MAIFTGFDWLEEAAASLRWEGNRKTEINSMMKSTTIAKLERKEMQALVKPSPQVESNLMEEGAIAEYRALADEVGVPASDMVIEEFRLFLSKRDLPTFNLGEVVKYMDDLTARDNPSRLGWQWCPVREKDKRGLMNFGTQSYADYNAQMNQIYQQGLGQAMWSSEPVLHAASDFYNSKSAAVYLRTVPIHALRKIALIEREFGKDKAVFLITDYVTAPHVVIKPDPFLMAVIPNDGIAQGKGRFVIDVWDEPGFGIEKQIK